MEKVFEKGDTMTQDEFKPDANQPPAQTEQSRGQIRTEQPSQQIPGRQASAPTSAPLLEQRVAIGRRPLFRS
jgi:hypothetical protein